MKRWLLMIVVLLLVSAAPRRPVPWVYISQPETGFETWMPITNYIDSGAATYVYDPTTGLETKIAGTHVVYQYYPGQ